MSDAAVAFCFMSAFITGLFSVFMNAQSPMIAFAIPAYEENWNLYEKGQGCRNAAIMYFCLAIVITVFNGWSTWKRRLVAFFPPRYRKSLFAERNTPIEMDIFPPDNDSEAAPLTRTDTANKYGSIENHTSVTDDCEHFRHLGRDLVFHRAVIGSNDTTTSTVDSTSFAGIDRCQIEHKLHNHSEWGYSDCPSDEEN